MKNLRTKLSYALYTLLCVVLFASCNKEELTEQKIGVITDAEVVPTSFNESIKVSIKTKDKFFVVYGLPQLNIGDTLIARMKGAEIKEVSDARGKWFKVRQHYTQRFVYAQGDLLAKKLDRMKEFISKWSNWWILAPKRKQLDDAFEKELNELIEREVALRIHDVVGRSEQLVCDCNKWHDRMEESNNHCSTCDKPIK